MSSDVRSGARSNPERTRAVAGFPPLKEKLHTQQFLGRANFLRNYLPPQYGYCAKVLGQYMKGTEKIPESGLGPGDSLGDKAVRAIKLMARRSIALAVLDEASAIARERPLEQIADSSGYAIGGSALQMRADLSGFNVLVTHSKGLTPAQQAWAPLSLEGYAQLEVRRAVKKILGPIRSICWTDHSNWTRQQTAGRKLSNATRIDLLTSVATLLRNISHYNPHVIVAAGQGAVIGLAAASPVVVETVMLSRNIQQGEATN